MSTVRDYLGIDGLLDDAHQKWPDWAQSEPLLPAGLEMLPAWLAAASPDGVRSVFVMLGRRGSLEGDGDDAAVAVLAWLLADAADLIASNAHVLPVHVAAELWIQIRSYPWLRPGQGSIPATILFSTSRQVRESEPTAHTVRKIRDGAIVNSALVERHITTAHPAEDDPVALTDLLRHARPEDRALLVTLAIEAHRFGQAATDGRAGRSRGTGGLLGPASRKVAAVRGVNPSTIKRQALRGLSAIREGIGAELATI